MWLILGLFGLAFLGFGSSVFALAVTRVPVLRTPVGVLREIRQAIGLQAGQVLVDAGCADGRALRVLCDRSGVRGRGYELNGPVWLVAWLRLGSGPARRRLRVYWRDFHRGELEDVDVVYCYLMPAAMERVARKCAREMPAGGRLVSFLWEVPGWQPSAVLAVGPLRDRVFIYDVHGCGEPGLETTAPSGDFTGADAGQAGPAAPPAERPKT